MSGMGFRDQLGTPFSQAIQLLMSNFLPGQRPCPPPPPPDEELRKKEKWRERSLPEECRL